MSSDASTWEWYGNAGHFIGGRNCRFHLCTEVGDYIVSTIGEYVPRGCDSPQPLGCEPDSLYETFVFECGGGRCTCGCGLPLPDDWTEIDSEHMATPRAAKETHMRMCHKYAPQKRSPAKEIAHNE